MPFGVPETGAALAPVGHNMPPPDVAEVAPFDLADLLDPELLRLQFGIDHEARIKRRDELLAGAASFFKAHQVIETEDVQAKAATFVKQIKGEISQVEKLRAAANAPFLAASRTVQEFFKAGILDRLDAQARGVEAKMSIFARKKIEHARIAAQDLARRKATEAAELAKAAESTMVPEALATAARAAEDADAAGRQTRAKPSEAGRTRSDTGAVATVQTRWTFELVDMADVPTEFLLLDEAAVRAAIAAGNREIPGLRVFETSDVKVR